MIAAAAAVIVVSAFLVAMIATLAILIGEPEELRGERLRRDRR